MVTFLLFQEHSLRKVIKFQHIHISWRGKPLVSVWHYFHARPWSYWWNWWFQTIPMHTIGSIVDFQRGGVGGGLIGKLEYWRSWVDNLWEWQVMVTGYGRQNYSQDWKMFFLIPHLWWILESDWFWNHEVNI